jgi:hypothetical protein
MSKMAVRMALAEVVFDGKVGVRRVKAKLLPQSPSLSQNQAMPRRSTGPSM